MTTPDGLPGHPLKAAALPPPGLMSRRSGQAHPGQRAGVRNKLRGMLAA